MIQSYVTGSDKLVSEMITGCFLMTRLIRDLLCVLMCVDFVGRAEEGAGRR